MEFKSFLKTEEKLQDVLNNAVMFFIKDDGVFACPEEERLVFAKIKEPDEDVTDINDLKFMATNLLRLLNGEEIDNMFGVKDLPKIKIIDKETAKKKLKK